MKTKQIATENKKTLVILFVYLRRLLYLRFLKIFKLKRKSKKQYRQNIKINFIRKYI